jgi:hypothetical protein
MYNSKRHLFIFWFLKLNFIIIFRLNECAFISSILEIKKNIDQQWESEMYQWSKVLV